MLGIIGKAIADIDGPDEVVDGILEEIDNFCEGKAVDIPLHEWQIAILCRRKQFARLSKKLESIFGEKVADEGCSGSSEHHKSEKKACFSVGSNLDEVAVIMSIFGGEYIKGDFYSQFWIGEHDVIIITKIADIISFEMISFYCMPG